MKKRTEYFLSYQFNNKESTGFGHCFTFHKIKNKNDLLEIKKAIEEELNLESVVILFYKKI